MPTDLQVLKVRMRRLGLTSNDVEFANQQIVSIFGGCDSCKSGCQAGCTTCNQGCSQGNQAGG